MAKVIVLVLCTLAALAILGATALYAYLWIDFYERWPPERIYVEQVAPDRASVALFSVKYRGIQTWFPVDVEPCAYVTVVDTRHGAVLERATAYQGTLRESFAELARRYAPWAGEAVEAGPWPD
jgi:hypothetical protein